MNLALSNLAWSFKDNDVVLGKLKEKGIVRIEGVLTKIDNWIDLDDYKVYKFKDTLNTFGIEVKTLQSIFYDVQFNSIQDKEKVDNHIRKIISYSKILNSNILVFGSPSLRKGRIDNSVVDSFYMIDDLMDNANMELSIEPNSRIYNGNYFYNLTEIVNFITSHNFKKIKTMVDTHNLVLEGYCPSEEFIKYQNYINHIHISEPGLKPMVDTDIHRKFYDTLISNNYKNTITYEVSNLVEFDSNIDTFIKVYGGTHS
jgi:sugar phosphate isomerase/epimerase